MCIGLTLFRTLFVTGRSLSVTAQDNLSDPSNYFHDNAKPLMSSADGRFIKEEIVRCRLSIIVMINM